MAKKKHMGYFTLSFSLFFFTLVSQKWGAAHWRGVRREGFSAGVQAELSCEEECGRCWWLSSKGPLVPPVHQDLGSVQGSPAPS